VLTGLCLLPWLVRFLCGNVMVHGPVLFASVVCGFGIKCTSATFGGVSLAMLDCDSTFYGGTGVCVSAVLSLLWLLQNCFISRGSSNSPHFVTKTSELQSVVGAITR